MREIQNRMSLLPWRACITGAGPGFTLRHSQARDARPPTTTRRLS